jgi:hypothetical protein
MVIFRKIELNLILILMDLDLSAKDKLLKISYAPSSSLNGLSLFYQTIQPKSYLKIL